MSYKIGICLPQTCSQGIAVEILKPFFRHFNLNINSILNCETEDTQSFALIQWLTAYLFIGLILFSCFGTWSDLAGKDSISTHFSLYKNINNLFALETQNDETRFLDGLRVIALLGSTWQLDKLLISKDMLNLLEYKYFSFDQSTLLMEIWIVTSALTTTFTFLNSYQTKRNFNIFKYYFHRYIHIMPVYTAVTAIIAIFGPFIATSGKIKQWKNSSYVKSCQENWWSGILLIQNYAHQPVEVVSIKHID